MLLRGLKDGRPNGGLRPPVAPTAQHTGPPPQPLGVTAAPAPARPGPPVPQPRAGSSGSRAGGVVVAFAAVLVAGIGGVVFMVMGAVDQGIDSWRDGIEAPFVEDVVGGEPSPSPDDAPGQPEAEPAAPEDPYSLSAGGIKAFVKLYRKEFGTTRTLGADLRPERASVDVPVDGRARHQSWQYREGSFSPFGDVVANSPGDREFDLSDLKPGKLMANIRRAHRTLAVEDPDTLYVLVRHRRSDSAAQVAIYLSNEFQEGGYLATTLDGSVLRSHPFQPR